MRLAAFVLALVALAGCQAKDRTPEGAAQAVWEATDGRPDDFRRLYPSRVEMRALFDERLANRFITQIDAATASLRRRPARARVTTVSLEVRRKVGPGNGLKGQAELARVRVKLKVAGVETSDLMALVRLGERWRALPKAALQFLR